jgi:hypothetical protein
MSIDFLRSRHLPVPSTRPAGVQIIVKESTARGADDDHATLVGHGPITVQAARDLIFGVPPRPGPFDFPDQPGGPRPAGTHYDWDRDRIAAEDDPDPPPPDDQWNTGPPDDWDPGSPGPPGPPDDPDPPPAPPGPTAGPVVCSPDDEPAWQLVDIGVIRVDDTGIAIPTSNVRMDYGRARRFFSPAQAKHVKTKWRRCAFPGCSMPIAKLDIDHPEEWTVGGETSITNAIPVCPHHNRTTRNRPGWDIAMNDDGTATLSTPMRRRYPLTPHNYLT